MGPIYSLGDFLDMVRRRLFTIACVFVFGCLASLWFAASQQHEYETAEVLQITQPQIAGELAKSTVEGSSARRMQLIEQRLMARGTLLEIIEKFGLYADQDSLTELQKVVQLRTAVQITGVAAAREGFADDGTISVLTITARMPTAEQAQQVASEFGRRTIELSISTRIDQARETLSFFVQKEAALADQVAALEDEIAAYRNANEVTLPGTIEFRRAEIAAMNEGLLEIARERIEIRRAADRAQSTERAATARRLQEEAEQQLATLDAQEALLTQRKAGLEASLQTTPEVERQLGAYDRRLEQLQGELAQMTARRNEAEVGFRLETSHQAERLTVIEPAPLPDYPVTGARKTKALMGAAASAVLALLAAFLQELRHPVLRTAAQMERETGLVPVVSIPVMDTRPPRRRLFRRKS
ncbi:chain-length determining protein [Leisingera sp. ANG-M7]|uniref:chain-length determining protein n=1 Tax=Leisingera sp. ANG-M7 TaxID=1577902 RepID=UPI00057DED5A|nr:chain-length determining protein [Leisingera sp. ANG-M7]KIC36730.1 chain-length determining protein [Leisingera sp. ANG-M7]